MSCPDELPVAPQVYAPKTQRKAFLRRAQAFFEQGKHERARKDLNELGPDDEAAKKLLQRLGPDEGTQV